MNGPVARTGLKYTKLTLPTIGAIVLLQLLCGWLGAPWNALIAWLGSLGAIFGLCWLSQQALDNYPQPPKTALLDVALLTDGTCEVRSVRCPLKEAGRMRFGAGPSMLLLAHSAALLIDPATAGMAERAVLQGLEAMKVDRRLAAEHSPQIGECEHNGLHWRIFKDGEKQRAYAMGSAHVVLPQCRSIWNGRALPFEDADRAALMTDCAAAGIPPVCIAMADMEDGMIGEPVYLGTFLFAHTIRADAEREITQLRALGLNVSLTGMAPLPLAEIASAVGCSTICPDRKPLVLTSKARSKSASISIAPGMSPSREAGLLMYMQQRLRYQPLYQGIAVTCVMLCCLLTGLPALAVGLCACMLIVTTLPAMNYPSVPQLPPVRVRLLKLGVSMAVMVAAAALCAVFFTAYAEAQSGALLPAVLPALLALGWKDMKQASRLRASMAVLMTAVLGIIGFGIACLLGASPLPVVFALLAGALGALPAVLLR